jgi:hypothetical protein
MQRRRFSRVQDGGGQGCQGKGMLVAQAGWDLDMAGSRQKKKSTSTLLELEIGGVTMKPIKIQAWKILMREGE